MNENILNNETERFKILKMVESGKLSANEGISLLQALGQERNSRRPANQPQSGGPNWFRVRVTDTISGKSKASISIPLGLMDWGLRIGAQFAPEVSNVNLEELGRALRTGVEGKIIDVIDDEDGEHVEIFVE
jgi:hypothetical protein